MSSTINVEPRRKLTNGGSRWRRKEKSKLQIYYMTHTHTSEKILFKFSSLDDGLLCFHLLNSLLMRTEWNSNFVVQPLEVKMVMRLLSFKMTMIKLQCANYFTKTFHYPRSGCNSSSRLLNVEHLDERRETEQNIFLFNFNFWGELCEGISKWNFMLEKVFLFSTRHFLQNVNDIEGKLLKNFLWTFEIIRKYFEVS